MEQYILEYLRVCALTPFFGAAILSTEKTLDTKLSCCLHSLSRTTGSFWGLRGKPRKVESI